MFTTSPGYKKTCSPECKKKATAVNSGRKKLHYPECRFCGTEFLGKGEYCCKTCEELDNRIKNEQLKKVQTKTDMVTDFVKKIPKGMSYGTFVGLMEMEKNKSNGNI